MSHLFLQGRVGNPRRSGPAISLITPRERRLLTAIGKATRQLLTEMRMPSVEDVTVMRLACFDDAITAALGENDRVAGFRDIIAPDVQHHDVPELDVAAALAIVPQGENPLLLLAEDERAQRFASDDPLESG
jgi:ATP-dependent RNA helicase DeaD